jgi:hypothetical protein
MLNLLLNVIEESKRYNAINTASIYIKNISASGRWNKLEARCFLGYPIK